MESGYVCISHHRKLILIIQIQKIWLWPYIRLKRVTKRRSNQVVMVKQIQAENSKSKVLSKSQKLLDKTNHWTVFARKMTKNLKLDLILQSKYACVQRYTRWSMIGMPAPGTKTECSMSQISYLLAQQRFLHCAIWFFHLKIQKNLHLRTKKVVQIAINWVSSLSSLS